MSHYISKKHSSTVFPIFEKLLKLLTLLIVSTYAEESSILEGATTIQYGTLTHTAEPDRYIGD